MSSGISTWRIIVRSTVGLGILFALLFGGAGTFAWPEAWLFILIQFSSSAVMVLWLRKYNPELLQERMDLWKRVVKPWDKAIVVRAYLEDKTLHQELEGYAAYAETVKYRLIPGIWYILLG